MDILVKYICYGYKKNPERHRLALQVSHHRLTIPM